MDRVLPKSFYAANIIGLAKIRRTIEKLGANMHDKKIINKILTNQIHQYINRFRHHGQREFIPRMQR